MQVVDLGRLPYQQAWDLQEEAHAQVLAGSEERLILLEHDPVITLGRRPGVARNLLASDEHLARLGVEVIQSDRGGDITFHGPGQIVAYPIVRLIDHGFSVGAYVHALERIVIETLAGFGIAAKTDRSAVGVWVDQGGRLEKICALGVRIRRGVSLHGIALNVTTDLSWFNLIVPCGLPGRAVTSMQRLLSDRTPPLVDVKQALSDKFVELLRSALSTQHSALSADAGVNPAHRA
ncbi:MAG TPA: lipoyl(octanoyl) transferase LipB [Tepidisphaeraceae bacterium]|jgi:lipoate-protein ligase B|nr:lipoyl(octanoyl) transferase LipB [Tepidisphaeraceae bacterium]